MEIRSGFEHAHIEDENEVDLLSVISTAHTIINRAFENITTKGVVKVKKGKEEVFLPIEQFDDMSDKEIVVYANPPYETPENAERFTLKFGHTPKGQSELTFGIVPNKVKGGTKNRVSPRKYILWDEEGIVRSRAEGLNKDEVSSHVQTILTYLDIADTSILNIGIYQSV